MKKFWKKIFFWVILIASILAAVLFVNWKIENGKKDKGNSENKPQQSPSKPSNNDNPTENPVPKPPVDAENWWLGEEEIEHAYQEIRKENTNHPEIQLVNPSVVRTIQEGGEISKDLKKAKIVFFPVNNPKQQGVVDTENQWTLLVYLGENLGFFNYNPSKFTFTPKNALEVAENFHKKVKLPAWPHVENVKDIPRQDNNPDSGVYVIAYTRAWINLYKEKQAQESGWMPISLDEKDFIFSISEERQKLKESGFPKK